MFQSIISVMLVTFISFLFIGVSGLMQAQITAAKGEWYDKVEVVVWLCPDGASQAASCSSGKAPSDQEIVDPGERDQRGSRQHRLQNHICEP